MWCRPSLARLFPVLCSVSACSEADTVGSGPADAGWTLADAAEPYQSERWPERAAPEPTGAFAAEHPQAFARLSRWSLAVEGEARPDTGHRGAFGVGNGHVFGLLGLTDPLNTLHGVVGPTYEKKERFFGDYAVYLVPAGERRPVPFETEWAAHSLTSPVALTHAERGGLELDTFDLAPWTDDAAVQGCIVRVLVVRNGGEAASEAVDVLVRPYHAAELEGEVLVEVAGERRLRTGFVGGGAEAHARYLALSLGALAPGAEVERVLLHCTYADSAPAALPQVDAGALLDESTTRYGTWEAGLVQVDLPDPMVADFIDGMKRTLKLQTSAGGASCPMSRYTRTWTRDNIGPLLAWTILGAHEDARAQVDYLAGAIRRGGGLSNSYGADLDLSDPPPEPDWANKEPLSGRVASETPSYLVWMSGIAGSWLGDTPFERSLIDYALEAQAFGPEQLLPWTGDETFRAALNATFGLDLEYPHQDRTWSLNSALLWLGAARRWDHPRFDAVEAATLARYRLPDGCLAAYLDRETLDPAPAPFEDVALKAIWAGWLDDDDPRAREQLGCLIDRLGVAPGVLQSPVHEQYAGSALLGSAEGVHTGMLPGYVLAALTRTGHPDAEAAFEAVRESLSPSGNVQEYHVYPDHSGLSLLYEASGTLGDYTARFRPWEGGIVVHAVLEYLTGVRGSVGAVVLRPHLPAGWDRMRFEGLGTWNRRYDLEVVRRPDATDVTLTNGALRPEEDVRLRWDLRPDEPGTGAVHGDDDARVVRRDHFGVRSVVVFATLPAGGSLTFRIPSK